jgi:hypothetical protein
MTLQREHIVRALAILGCIAAAAWVVHNTEWVDETVYLPARGEAADDPMYAIKQVVQRLGMRVVAPLNFDRLPPPQATLVLHAFHWNLFPQREEALRRWVEDGGHLVVPAWSGKERGLGWVPITTVHPERPAAQAAGRPEPVPARSPAQPPCETAREPDSVPPAFGTHRDFRLCSHDVSWLSSATPAQWSLATPRGAHALRIAAGRGSVTALRYPGSMIRGRDTLHDDRMLAFVAALRLAPGGEVWFVQSETRTPLLRLVWQSGAPAVLLAALALALALWRGGVRFGPRAPVPPLARRSVAEQVRGTAQFIFRRDAAALHRAQLRALEQVARRRIPQHDRLARRARAEAIARAAGLQPDDLARAMDPSLQRPHRDLIVTLTLLETASRRLAAFR